VGVPIVTGDTKVVDRGKGDGIFINTAGIGLVPAGIDISPRRVKPGDAVLLSGDLGRHGMAIMSVREGLSFQSALESDCASLSGLVEAMLLAGRDIHCLRDLTRGGLAAALNEIAGHARVGIELQETAIPISEPVAGACELLGLDPLYVANEGRLVAFVPAQAAEEVLQIMQAHPAASGPAIVGEVTDRHPGMVEMRGLLGGGRIVDLLSGEQMPRIC
jgi:hydrogenase expression/formation protein HypE